MGPCTRDIPCEVTTSDFDFSSGYSSMGTGMGMSMGNGMNATGIVPGFAGKELDGAEGAVR